MKKLVALLGLVVMSTASVFATTWGNPNIIKCPECKEKLVESVLNSYNTFGSDLWSDTKLIAPMKPTIPFIIKCPKCGEIFLRNDNVAKRNVNQNAYKKYVSTTSCQLRFDDFEKAFPLFRDKETFYWMAIWAYNDFFRYGQPEKAAERREKFEQYAREFLSILEESDELNNKIMRAELHRELGETDKCIEILDEVKDEDFEWVVALIREKAQNNETEVFILQGLSKDIAERREAERQEAETNETDKDDR